MKILVTGGAGFIGSRIADRFLKEGFDVHILDDLSTGKAENIPHGARLHVLDIRDKEVHELFNSEKYSVMIHTAAQLDIRRSVEEPIFDAEVNILGLLNLMEAGRKNGLRKVIFSSTGGAIYGEPKYVPQDENHDLKPVSPYGITKLAAEKYLYFYGKLYDITPVILRYANVYGPGQRSDGEGGVVSIFIRKMLTGESPIIFGDGSQTRDYVFVDDVAEANLMVLSVNEAFIFNIGTGEETSVNTLFALLQQATNPLIEPSYGSRRDGEQQRSVLSYDRIRSKLGWEPTIKLEDGLEETIAWFKSRMDRML